MNQIFVVEIHRLVTNQNKKAQRDKGKKHKAQMPPMHCEESLQQIPTEHIAVILDLLSVKQEVSFGRC